MANLIDAEYVMADKPSQTREIIDGYNQERARRLAHKYSITMSRWLEINKKTLDRFDVCCGVEDVEKQLQIKNALEVVKWYVMFIPLKTNCAMHQYEDEVLNQSPFIRGSSKIAVIAINRTIQSLVILYEICKHHYEDDILYFLKLLNELKARILLKVPDAMEYIRPGLDEQ